MGIAVDSSGNVFVADLTNHRIQKFSSDGDFIEMWGSRGSGDGQFLSPYGIAIDSLDYVYVTERDNNRVQKFLTDTPPTITSFTVDPLVVGAKGEITITASVSDNKDISSVTALIKATASAETIDSIKLQHESGSMQSGTWSETFTFPPMSTALDGDYDVEITTKDGTGLSVKASIPIVLDRTSPELVLPSSMEVQAIDPSGAVVIYTATATDNIDGDIFPQCTPPPDSWFNIGTTIVNCSATDSAGNESKKLFEVTVKSSTTDSDGPNGFPGNKVPVADAGTDQTVEEGKSVTLDGIGSSDVDGDRLTFQWSLISSSPVTLTNSDKAEATFTAPRVAVQTLLMFQLIVNDGKDDSLPDTVMIRVMPVGETPVEETSFTLSSNLDGNTYVVVGEAENLAPLAFTINPNKSVQFDLAGGEGGELDLTLPKEMMSGIRAVQSEEETLQFQIVSVDTTSTTLRFTVPDNTDSIEINGAFVVPEFPFATILLAGIITFSLLIVRAYKPLSFWVKS